MKPRWYLLQDFIGIEKPVVIAILGKHAHYERKVAIASRARTRLIWIELEKPLSSANEMVELIGKENEAYILWIRGG